MATVNIIEEAKKRCAQLEHDLGEQQAIAGQAGANLLKLREEEAALLLDGDLLGKDNTRALAVARQRQEEARARLTSAEASASELTARLERTREPLLQLEYKQWQEELAALGERAGLLYRQYRDATATLVALATEMNTVRARYRTLYALTTAFTSKRHLQAPAPPARTPKPFPVLASWIAENKGKEQWASWLRDKETATYKEFA